MKISTKDFKKVQIYILHSLFLTFSDYEKDDHIPLHHLWRAVSFFSITIYQEYPPCYIRKSWVLNVYSQSQICTNNTILFRNENVSHGIIWSMLVAYSYNNNKEQPEHTEFV